MLALVRRQYVTKNDFELAQSLSVIIDARKHIKNYPSLANDTGTAPRTGTHFLERVLNSKSAELAPTQAAAIALGFKSSVHTHSYVNMYAWDSERLVRILAAGGSTLADDEGAGADFEACQAVESHKIVRNSFLIEKLRRNIRLTSNNNTSKIV